MKLALTSCVSAIALLQSGAAMAQASATDAQAQPAPAPQAAQATGGTANSDIIVTARRREERLQDVPISISAVSGDQLDQRGVTNILDIQNVTPGLSITGTYSQRSAVAFSMRGQRAQEIQLLTDSPVGIYFAEVNQPRPYGLGNNFFDLRGVQVLKGVQGTLFGRNMTGGAVLIEPEHPKDNFEAEVRGSYGNFDLREVYGMINVPLGEKAALRVAAKVRRRDGWARDVVTGQDFDNQRFESYRGSLVLRPTDTIESLTIGDYYHSRENGTAAFLTSLDTGPGSVLANYENLRRAGLPFPNLPAQFAEAQRLGRNYELTSGSGGGSVYDVYGRPYENIDNWGVTNKTSWTINDNITLKNIAGFRHLKRDVVQDYDGIPAFLIAPRQTQDIKTYSEELQLQGNAFENKLTYILGGFAFRESGSDDSFQNTLPQLTILGAQGPAGLFNGTPASRYRGSQESSGVATSYAAFAAGTYSLTDQLKLSGGIRYNYDKRSAVVGPQSPGLGVCTYDVNVTTPGTQSVPLAQCRFTDSKSWDAITWDATLQYAPSEHLTTYGSVRRGYRSGGFSLRAANPVQFRAFNPETVMEYEVGVKTDTPVGTGRLTTSTALFYQDSKNVQKQRTEAATLLTIIDNTAAVRSYGGEFEGSLSFPMGFSMSGFYSYTNVKIKEGAVFGRLGNQEFDQRGVPRHKVGVTLAAELPTSPAFGDTNVSATYAYTGKQHLDEFDIQGDEPGYSLLNLRAEVSKIGGTGFDLTVFANNALNQRYRTGTLGLVSELGFGSSVYGEPRTYGLEVGYKF